MLQFYRIFTKLLPQFYETFTKVLPNFYETFTKFLPVTIWSEPSAVAASVGSSAPTIWSDAYCKGIITVGTGWSGWSTPIYRSGAEYGSTPLYGSGAEYGSTPIYGSGADSGVVQSDNLQVLENTKLYIIMSSILIISGVAKHQSKI